MSGSVPSGVVARRLVPAVVLVMLPVVVTGLGPWHAHAYLLFLAVPPALVGFGHGPRTAWSGVGLATVATAVGMLAAGSPLAGALAVAAACTGVAWAARRGLSGLATTASVPLLLALFTTPTAPGVVAGTGSHPGQVTAVAAVVAAGGAWAVLVARALLPRPSRAGVEPEPARVALAYGLILVPLTAVATYLAMRWFPGTHAWWAVLTMMVVLQPTFADTAARAGARTLGTVVGALVAVLVVDLVPVPEAQVVIGAVAAAVAGLASLTRPYAQFAALLTLSVVLMTGVSTSTALVGTERVVATLVGAGAVLAVVALGRLLRGWAVRGAGAAAR